MVNDLREFKRLLEEIRWLDAELYGKDFVLTWERSIKEVRQVLFTAEALKWLYDNNISIKCFESGIALVQVGDRHTPREACSRLFFVMAANFLGLTTHQVEYHGKEIRELCHSFLTGVEIVGVQELSPRVVEEIEDPKGTATAAEGASQTVSAVEPPGSESSPRQPGIINLQCSWDNPIQAMADMLLLKDHFLSLERLAGKKIAVVWDNNTAPISSPSVPQGFVALASRFGMMVNLAYPKGYDLSPHVINVAKRHSESSSGAFVIVPSLEQALTGADAVYRLNWDISPPKEHTALLKSWTCTPDKMQLTNDGTAFSMSGHDADRYKPYIITAIMVNNRLKDPAKLLGHLRKKNTQRLLSLD